MPTLVRLDSCKLSIYAGDHNPPHFHVLASDGSEALIDIESLAVLRGKLKSPVLATALAWARLHQHDIAEKWKELNP